MTGEMVPCGDPVVELVMNWPADFVARAGKLLLRLSDVSSLHRDEMAELVDAGLLSRELKVTEAGQCLADLVIHEHWITDDEVPSFLQRGAERLSGDVLDVGCSTGWILRNLRQPLPRSRVGVDIDDRALALAKRFAEVEQQEITFLNASVHKLPFPSNSFDWVICRNAISYTHQKTAIREMTRVLRPGGYLFLRFENFRYDLQRIWNSRGPRELLCRMRDITYGMVHSLLGVQPVPGSLLRGGRAFGSPRRLTSLLKCREMEVIAMEGSRSCPLVLGKPNQTSLLSRKRSTLALVAQDDTLLMHETWEMARS